jgi:hypothetical protein
MNNTTYNVGDRFYDLDYFTTIVITAKKLIKNEELYYLNFENGQYTNLPLEMKQLKIWMDIGAVVPIRDDKHLLQLRLKYDGKEND